MTKDELKALRIKLGLTQAEMGELLGLKWVQVSRLERGESKITDSIGIIATRLWAESGNQ